MERVLVTGGAGFIGSHIVRRLVTEGARVRVMDNLSSGDMGALEPVLDRIEFVEADIRDAGELQQCMRGVDLVLHEAAIASVPLSIDRPDLVHEVNATGTLNVLEQARRAGVKRLVYAASSAVYGNNPALPKRETMVAELESPYAAAKHAGELYARVYDHSFGLETVCLRYFNVFGPGQSPASQYAAVIPAFFAAVLAGRSPDIFGDGEQTRDLVFVEDVVTANFLASAASGAAGLSLNIAGGKPVSLNQLLAAISEVTGSRIHANYRPERPGDVRHSLAAIDEARQRLGWAPETSLSDGLRATFEWFKRTYARGSAV
ncbi:MAG: SDR family oxidoreductase [Symbiobacteriia bacterium]